MKNKKTPIDEDLFIQLQFYKQDSVSAGADFYHLSGNPVTRILKQPTRHGLERATLQEIKDPQP